MAEKDKYTRGKSGLTVADEKDRKHYSDLDYADTAGSPLPESERLYRKNIGAPTNFTKNLRTPEGREINKKNMDFLQKEVNRKGVDAGEAGKKWDDHFK